MKELDFNHKVAFVIACKNYKYQSKLPGAKVDGDLVCKTLRKIGFKVRFLPDATRDKFDSE
jgi:hypothetical protein